MSATPLDPHLPPPATPTRSKRPKQNKQTLTSIPMTSDQSWEKLSDKAAPSAGGSAAAAAAWGEEEEAAAPLPCSPSIASRMCRPAFSHTDTTSEGSERQTVGGRGRRGTGRGRCRPPGLLLLLLLFAKTLPLTLRRKDSNIARGGSPAPGEKASARLLESTRRLAGHRGIREQGEKEK